MLVGFIFLLVRCLFLFSLYDWVLFMLDFGLYYIDTIREGTFKGIS